MKEGRDMRAFVALELSSETRDRLAELRRSLTPAVRGVRWVRPEGTHLTLRFLGDSSPGQLQRIESGLQRAAAACPACEAPLRGLGLFPPRGTPRVIWVGIALSDAVVELQRACEQAAVSAGFAAERRPFRAHLTLGRFRERVPRPTLPEVDLGAVPLQALVLYRSQLRPEGAVYSELARFPLAAAGVG